MLQRSPAGGIARPSGYRFHVAAVASVVWFAPSNGVPVMKAIRAVTGLLLFAAVLLAGACGGSGSSNPTPVVPPPPPPPILDPQFRASAASPFTATCDGAPINGTAFINAEVEPYLAINPRNPRHFVGVWQQDRWSNGSARGIVTGTSLDGGQTWTRRAMRFSRCGGGNPSNGGDFARATDPWVTFAPDGTVHQMALVTNGASFQPGSTNAMLASRSLDGGLTWSDPLTLIRDGSSFFNDKNTITADPGNPQLVYAVWDRLTASGAAPTYFARSTDAGVSWEPARAIHDPGATSQTVGNVIAVLPNGTLINLLTQIDTPAGGTASAFLAVLRSTDKGATWSGPVRIADLLAIGARDPDTGTAVRDGSILAQIAVDSGGRLVVVWQDARFSGGVHDGIALARSVDGGLTWSAPTRVNNNGTVQAFTPTVHVRDDGMIGVTYYDFSSNTADPTTLPTDYWLTRSVDAVTWRDHRVAGPFDLTTAPDAGGLFLGDYQSLSSVDLTFIPFFVQTNSGNLDNRTDVFVAPAVSATTSAMTMASEPVPAAAPPPVTPPRIDPEFRQRVHDNIVRSMERRVPGWRDAVRRQSESAIR